MLIEFCQDLAENSELQKNSIEIIALLKLKVTKMIFFILNSKVYSHRLKNIYTFEFSIIRRSYMRNLR